MRINRLQPPDAPLALIGFAEALSAPEVTWSLADGGFRVVAFGRRGRKCALRRSRYAELVEITAPEKDAEAAARELGQLSSRIGAQGRVLVYPLDDAAVWLCGRVRWPAQWQVAACSGAGLRLALDKSYQVQLAQQCGLRTPATRVVRTVEEALSLKDSLPLVLKSAGAVVVQDGRIRKGRNWICGSPQELERAVEQWQGRWPLLAQPFLAGTGEGVFGLATDSGVQAWSAHSRLRMMNPHGSGASACQAQPVPEAVKVLIEKLVTEARWRGLFMVELLRDPAGQHWFIEFNGRPWGSIALSRRQGFEYPAWAARLTFEPGLRVEAAGRGMPGLVCRHAGREVMHLLFVLRGRKSTALKDWPSVWRALLGVCSKGRTDRLYNYRSDDRWVFLSDCWCTIRDQVFKS